jgi:membrane fusion protein, multidrug efflux system
MAEPALKLAPTAAPPIATEVPAPEPASRLSRGRLRLILLVVIPLLAVAAGLGIYLAGGRYISTDNAYVGAQKVLITTDISGKISRIVVTEGQRVQPGDVLFEIDPVPFRIAETQAEARVANVRTDLANLKSNLQAYERQIALAQENVSLKQKDYDRKAALVASRAVSQADVDTTMATLVAAKNQLEQLIQQSAVIRNQLLGNPDLPVEQYPPYMQATAALDQAKRDLDHTVVRAPIVGSATQVDSIQLGRYVTAGTPVFSLVDDGHPWVDANPKETDITLLRVGQKATLNVDTFPDRTFHGVVQSVSAGTGAQFAILPPQNATGNWVKVVQRVPLRIVFEPGEDVSLLRSGMSVNVDIDTGHKRTFGSLFSFLAPAKSASSVATK